MSRERGGYKPLTRKEKVAAATIVATVGAFLVHDGRGPQTKEPIKPSQKIEETLPSPTPEGHSENKHERRDRRLSELSRDELDYVYRAARYEERKYANVSNMVEMYVLVRGGFFANLKHCKEFFGGRIQDELKRKQAMLDKVLSSGMDSTQGSYVDQISFIEDLINKTEGEDREAFKDHLKELKEGLAAHIDSSFHDSQFTGIDADISQFRFMIEALQKLDNDVKSGESIEEIRKMVANAKYDALHTSWDYSRLQDRVRGEFRRRENAQREAKRAAHPASQGSKHEKRNTGGNEGGRQRERSSRPQKTRTPGSDADRYRGNR